MSDGIRIKVCVRKKKVMIYLSTLLFYSFVPQFSIYNPSVSNNNNKL